MDRFYYDEWWSFAGDVPPAPPPPPEPDPEPKCPGCGGELYVEIKRETWYTHRPIQIYIANGVAATHGKYVEIDWDVVDEAPEAALSVYLYCPTQGCPYREEISPMRFGDKPINEYWEPYIPDEEFDE